MGDIMTNIDDIVTYISTAYKLPSSIHSPAHSLTTNTSSMSTRIPSHCRATVNESNNVRLFFITAPKTRDHLPKIPPKYKDGDIVIVDPADIYTDHVQFIKQSGYHVYARISAGAAKHYVIHESPSLLGSIYGDNVNMQWIRLATHRKLEAHFAAMYARVKTMGFDGVYMTDVDMVSKVPENTDMEAELVQYIKMHYKKAYKHELPLILDVSPSLVRLNGVLDHIFAYFCGFHFDHGTCTETVSCRMFASLQSLLNKIVERGCDIWHANETATC
ncbi:hypothetical protein SARC_06414 [Sphaeroforma arctica JP610]|uniref:Glycoside-hydrolase family GH114 TIM-barrel domain-containing protein n=1 Tax=Sphaeroforma arctica JP610 TaxID=667725 RepID=A0A0L0FX71_9EUKA|nr:hypothetical protein SARC_06414 [Sphaeroforma arctica JP610]KNC81239.1 hypothetical protein SARC_06414 [Sphaeroforma arctica JP610]|eukprot:XP_014155141.1 hypothetical protein SARC_06414 [Sphaeroforma arctica JP610]